MKVWIATYVDNGETCDGKPGVLGVYGSEEKAVAAVNDDIKTWADEHVGENVKIDFDKMSAYYATYDDDVGCEWEIEEIDLPIEGHIAFSLK